MPDKNHHQPGSRPVQLQLNLPQRILVVDQDPYVRHLSADVLIRHGFEVNAVADGGAGWNELKACHYHLLITEHDLPNLTGIELVRKLRAARMVLPVVMAACKLPLRALAQNPSLQFSAMLLKPLPVDALLDTVRIILYSATRGSGDDMDLLHSSRHQSRDLGWGSQRAAAPSRSERGRQGNKNGRTAFAQWGSRD